MRSEEFSSQFDRKKNLFYFPLCAGFLNQMGQNSDLTAFTSKDQVFPRPE